MAKGEKGRIQQETQASQNRTQQQYQSYLDNLNARNNALIPARDAERENVYNRWNTAADTRSSDTIDRLRGYIPPGMPGSTQAAPAAGSGSGGDSGGDSGTPTAPPPPPPDYWGGPEGYWTNIANTGGVDMGRLEEALPGLRGMSESGGFEGDRLNSLNEIIRGFRSIGDSGIDPSQRAQIERNLGVLTDQAQNGPFSAADRARISGDINSLRNTSFDPAALSRIRGDINQTRGLASTGGFNAEDLAASRGRIQSLSELGDRPLSDEDIARFRGTGFEEFARTGGWSPEQIADARDRATSVIPAQFARDRATLDRQRAVQGGYAPGFAAALARTARERNYAQSAAARDAELGIQDQVRQGRQFGITGMRDTEAALQDIITRTRLGAQSSAAQYGTQLESNVASNRLQALREAGRGEAELEGALADLGLRGRSAALEGEMTLGDLTSRARREAATAGASQGTAFASADADARLRGLSGAGETELGLGRTISENRLRAMEGISSTNLGAQTLRQRGLISGAEGLTGIAQMRLQEELARRAQAAAGGGGGGGGGGSSSDADARFWAQFAAGNERWAHEMALRERLAGMEGLQGLYGMDPTLPRERLPLDALNSMSGSNLDYLRTRGGLESGPSSWDRFMQGAGVAGNLLNSFGGGSRSSGGNSDQASYGMPEWRRWETNWSSGAGGDLSGGQWDDLWNMPVPSPPPGYR